MKSRYTTLSNKKVPKSKSLSSARKKSGVTAENLDPSGTAIAAKSVATEEIRFSQRIRNKSIPSDCESINKNKRICSQQFKNTCDNSAYPEIIVIESNGGTKSLPEATTPNDKKVLKAKSSNSARKKTEVTLEKSVSSRASNKIAKSAATQEIRILQRIRSTSVPSSYKKSVNEKKTICSQEFKNTCDTPSCSTITVNKSGEGKKSVLEATIPSDKEVLKAKSSNSARKKSKVTSKKSDSSETSSKMIKSVTTKERRILQRTRTRSKSVFSNCGKSMNKTDTVCSHQFNNTSETCDTSYPAIPVSKSGEGKKYLPVSKTKSSSKRRLESPNQVPIPSSDNVISGKEDNKKTLNAKSPTPRSKNIKSSSFVGSLDYLKGMNNSAISVNETDVKIKGDPFSYRVNCNPFPHKMQELNSRNSPVNPSVACEEESIVLNEEPYSPEKVDNGQRKKSISSQHSLHLDNIFKCERHTSSNKTDKKSNKLEDNAFANNSVQTSAEESIRLLKKKKSPVSVNLKCSLVPSVDISHQDTKADQDIKNYKSNVTLKSNDKGNQSSFIHGSLGDSSKVIGKKRGSLVKLQSELDPNALPMLDQEIKVNTKNLTHKSDAKANQNSRKRNSLEKPVVLIKRRKRSASEELKYQLHHYVDMSDHDIRDDTKKVIFKSEVKGNWSPFIHDASSDSSTAIRSQRRSSIQVKSGLIHSVDIPMSDLETEVNRNKLTSDAKANHASPKRGSLDESTVLDKRVKKPPSAEPKCRLQQFVDTSNYDEIKTKKRQPKIEDREQPASQPRLFLKTCEDISVSKRNVKDSTPEKPEQFSEIEHSFLSSDPHILNKESNSTQSEMSIEEHLVSHTPDEESNSTESDMSIEENLISQNSIPPCQNSIPPCQNSIPPYQNSYGYISQPVLLPVQQTNSNLANKSFILANAIIPHPQINNQWVFPHVNPLICQPQGAYPMQNYYVIAMPQLPITYPIYQTVPLLQQSNIQCNNSLNTDFGTLQPNNFNVAAQNANNAEKCFDTSNTVDFNNTTSGTTRKRVTKMRIFKQTSLACSQSARVAFNKPDKCGVKNFNKKCGEILQNMRKICLNDLENDGRKWFSHNPSQSQITVNQFYSNPVVFKVLGERICKMTTEMTIPSKFQYVFGDSFFESPIREVMKDYVDFYRRSLYRGPAYKDYFVKRAFKKLPFGSCLYLCEAFPEENEFVTHKDLICYLSSAALLEIFYECKKRNLL